MKHVYLTTKIFEILSLYENKYFDKGAFYFYNQINQDLLSCRDQMETTKYLYANILKNVGLIKTRANDIGQDFNSIRNYIRLM